MAEAAAEPDPLASAAITVEVGPAPLDVWTKLRAHSDTELKLRSCSAASVLRKAFLLQLAARLESDEERRVDELAQMHSDGPGALASADQYAVVLRELCQSARTRLATSVQQVPGTGEGEESEEASLARVVGAHADALDKHLSLAEQLGHSHRAAALGAACAVDPLARRATPASAAAPIPKSTMRAFRDVGIEPCLIAQLDEADAAILWGALCLDIVPPDPWDGHGALVSLADGPMTRPAEMGISEEMMEHLTADELAGLRATLAAPQPGRDAGLPPRQHLALTYSGGDGAWRGGEGWGALRPDRVFGTGRGHVAEEGSIAGEGIQTAEQAVRAAAALRAAGVSLAHRGSAAAQQEYGDVPAGRGFASNPFVLGDSRGARGTAADAYVETETGSQIQSFRTRLSQLGERAPRGGRAGWGYDRYTRAAESSLSTRDATAHWEAQADEQHRRGQQGGCRPGASQVSMAAGRAQMDQRQRSAAEARVGAEERQREMERRQQRAIDEAIAVRNSGEGGRSGRPAPNAAVRTNSTACRAPSPHQVAAAQQTEQPDRHRHNAPSLPAASTPAPASSTFFSSFASWFG